MEEGGWDVAVRKVVLDVICRELVKSKEPAGSH